MIYDLTSICNKIDDHLKSSTNHNKIYVAGAISELYKICDSGHAKLYN